MLDSTLSLSLSSGMQRTGVLVVSLVAAACTSQVRIESDVIEALGEELGESSARLVSLDPSPGDEALRDATGQTGDDLVELVLAHDDWATLDGEISELVVGALEADASDTFSWDGDVLDVAFVSASDEGATTHSVALQRRTGVVRSDLPTTYNGQDISSFDEIDGQPVFLPPFIEGTYELSTTRTIGGEPTSLRLHADYVQLTLDGDACAAGGGVDIHYLLSSEATERGGFVRASYHGCGRIIVFTR